MRATGFGDIWAHLAWLAPGAGAFGTIRCTIAEIAITPVADYQEADK
jgi:hypothetical protein